MMKALVIFQNESTVELGCLLAIARSEACRREGVRVNPAVRALVFVGALGLYFAVYEVSSEGKMVNRNSVSQDLVIEKSDNEKMYSAGSGKEVS